MSNCKNCIYNKVCISRIYYDENFGDSSKLNHNCADFEDIETYIKLPCGVGDVFYGINETSYDAYCVYGFKYGKRRGEECNEIILITTYDMEFVFGEEAFLTKEEANQKLNELKARD